MDERDHGHGPSPQPPHAPDPYYRIGTQVDDHEVRIRLLERESLMLTESVKQIRAALDDIGESLEKSQTSVDGKLSLIDSRLSAHVVDEAGNLKRLFVSAVVQFLVVVAGFLFVILEGRL